MSRQEIASDGHPSNDDESTRDGVVLGLMRVPAPGKSAKEMFLNMASKLRGRTNGNRVKRVIGPIVYCEKAENGTTGSYQALLDFFDALGLDATAEFTLEPTPSPTTG